jgi:hypothetical protein
LKKKRKENQKKRLLEKKEKRCDIYEKKQERYKALLGDEDNVRHLQSFLVIVTSPTWPILK